LLGNCNFGGIPRLVIRERFSPESVDPGKVFASIGRNYFHLWLAVLGVYKLSVEYGPVLSRMRIMRRSQIGISELLMPNLKIIAKALLR
ncbi:hypothetical protein, partial [Labrys miyagiensis]|uniref:hypothetical protein n=1 Tax=Labrys miyagiensis TaxID=346912 RepID=UPI0024E05CA1